MSSKKPELRMYFLVMYNISPIQQGIQALHACVEYFLKYWKTKEFWEWAKTHKTVIILNGGTSNDGTGTMYGMEPSTGSMEQHFDTLKANKIKCAGFNEPDLNYSLSAIAFLVDEKVFNKKDYPDFYFDEKEWNRTKNPMVHNMDHDKVQAFKKFQNEVGKDAAFLKDFLKQFKLA